MSKPLHLKFGEDAEIAAVNFLQKKQYKILYTNWRHNHLEIDIIAKHDNFIVFIEVKARESDEYGHPYEFVIGKKERNIITAANYFLEHKMPDNEGRFDVVTILKKESDFLIEHFVDAFNILA